MTRSELSLMRIVESPSAAQPTICNISFKRGKLSQYKVHHWECKTIVILIANECHETTTKDEGNGQSNLRFFFLFVLDNPLALLFPPPPPSLPPLSLPPCGILRSRREPTGTPDDAQGVTLTRRYESLIVQWKVCQEGDLAMARAYGLGRTDSGLRSPKVSVPTASFLLSKISSVATVVSVDHISHGGYSQMLPECHRGDGAVAILKECIT
ncbi:uncharacterized protein LOC126851583 [Cataglyphis hispanica]|uniref:uncharacterized protein LOC126851583 n=1 Tax=Cataglyphis hispanica TaxID=1086592 RepID=UPI00218013C0|nr:uncharacterized protein LOC126851583 [Cataglyphis hispanica]